MKSFEDLTVVQHRAIFNLNWARNWGDAFALHHVCQVLAPTQVLEVGYCQGFTMGLMFESCGDNAKFTSVDIDYSHDCLQSICHIADRTRFVCEDSLTFSPLEQFDFVVIDGAHDYEHVRWELAQLDRWCLDRAIVLVDDYAADAYPDVGRALADFLPGSGFQPVLIGHQQLFIAGPALDHDHITLLQQVTWPWLHWDTREVFGCSDVPRYRIKLPDLADRLPELYSNYVTRT